MRPLRACAHSGCPTLVKAGRCQAHARPAWQGAGKSYGSAHAAMRRRVLAEEPTCRQCGGVTTQADHIVPKAQGGSDERENYQGLCDRCHRRKSGRDGARGRWRGRAHV